MNAFILSRCSGYMAPEYLLHGNLSKKADVFSFGVVVLELISGQKNSSFDRDPDSGSLLEWVIIAFKRLNLTTGIECYANRLSLSTGL